MTNIIDKCNMFAKINLNKAGVCRRADIAFINAAKVHQPQNSDTVIARVMGYNGAKTDHIYNANANAPYYTSSPSSFSTFTTIRIQPK